ncbi:MAG: hypothetical protein QNJ14_15570 [Woeseiaceae bacterium]|nr:hypothetical protein [Woeseiaceae bacterium]
MRVITPSIQHFLLFCTIVGVLLATNARAIEPLTSEPYSLSEMFEILVQRRAETFNAGGAPREDTKIPRGQHSPRGQGVGADAAYAPGGVPGVAPLKHSPKLAGDSTFAVIQVIDKDGNLIDFAAGEHVDYAGRGSRHAERGALDALEPDRTSALGKLEHPVAGRVGRADPAALRGGKVLVMVDQVVCEACATDLQNFARRHGMELEVRLPQRDHLRRPGVDVSPKTATRTSQYSNITEAAADNPRVGVRFVEQAEVHVEPADPQYGGFRLSTKPASKPAQYIPSSTFLVGRATYNIGVDAVGGLLIGWMVDDFRDSLVALRAQERDARDLATILRDPANQKAMQLARRYANDLPVVLENLLLAHDDWVRRQDMSIFIPLADPQAASAADLDKMELLASARAINLLRYQQQLQTLQSNIRKAIEEGPAAKDAAELTDMLAEAFPYYMSSLPRQGFSGDEITYMWTLFRGYGPSVRLGLANARLADSMLDRLITETGETAAMYGEWATRLTDELVRRSEAAAKAAAQEQVRVTRKPGRKPRTAERNPDCDNPYLADSPYLCQNPYVHEVRCDGWNMRETASGDCVPILESTSPSVERQSSRSTALEIHNAAIERMNARAAEFSASVANQQERVQAILKQHEDTVFRIGVDHRVAMQAMEQRFHDLQGVAEEASNRLSTLVSMPDATSQPGHRSKDASPVSPDELVSGPFVVANSTHTSNNRGGASNTSAIPTTGIVSNSNPSPASGGFVLAEPDEPDSGRSPEPWRPFSDQDTDDDNRNPSDDPKPSPPAAGGSSKTSDSIPESQSSDDSRSESSKSDSAEKPYSRGSKPRLRPKDKPQLIVGERRREDAVFVVYRNRLYSSNPYDSCECGPSITDGTGKYTPAGTTLYLVESTN